MNICSLSSHGRNDPEVCGCYLIESYKALPAVSIMAPFRDPEEKEPFERLKN